MSANFTPSMEPYKETGSFKFWCNKVLPLVYDDSLSYYETLCKVVNYLNDVIANVDGLHTDVTNLLFAFNQLQGYVNTYFDNLDVQNEINHKLDVMAEDGTLSALLSPVVATQIGGVVGEQIGDTVASQIGATVAGQIGGVVAEQIGEPAATATTAWLNEHVTPVGSAVVVDDSLTIEGAAADAKATGDAVNALNTALTDTKNIVYQDNTFAAEFGVVEGGLTTAGATNTSNKRCRTRKIALSGCNYLRFVLLGDTYKIINAHAYATESSETSERVITKNSNNEVIINRNTGENYIALSFAHIDDTQEITDEDISAVASAIKLLSISDDSMSQNGAAADARTLGRLASVINGIANTQRIKWNGTQTHPLGWRSGRWADDGTVISDSRSICQLGRITIPGSTGSRRGVVGIFVRCNTGFIELKKYNSGIVTDVTSSKKVAYMPCETDDMIGVTIRGLNNPSSDYLTEEFIETIYVSVMFQPTHKSMGSTEYFYIPINTTWIDGNADSVNTVNVDSVLMLPSNYSPSGEPTKLIFMHHGNTGTVNVEDKTWYSEVNTWSNFVNAYLNAGYAVFDVNGCGPVSDSNANHDYGAFGALQAAFKAYKYILNKYNVSEKIMVHGSSMGGITAYAFAKIFPEIVEAVGLFSPAQLSHSAQSVNLDDYIAVNYGYTDVESMVTDDYSRLISASPSIDFYNDGVKTYKPYTYEWVDNHQTDGLDIECKDFNAPIKIWCGTADTAVNPNYGKELCNAITKKGGLAIFRSVSGATHTMSTGANSTVKSEAVMWFNRFK